MKPQLLGLLGITLTSCLTLDQAIASPEEDWQKLFEVQLQRAYQRAVEDAYDAQPDEIHHQLWAITPDNPQLIWRKEKGQRQVLMVTWTSWDGYGDRGYSLTRLGYTYDWGNLETEAGASEFVIRKGAEVEIESVTETIDYVRGKQI